jgi:hypothetical protein
MPALASNIPYKGVELYPIVSDSGLSVRVNDISEGHVAGSTVGNSQQAHFWTSPNGDAVSLHPTNLDGFFNTHATALEGNQQVGQGNSVGGSHALLWNGLADSAVDLHPTSLNDFAFDSIALGTNGTQQVGNGYATSAGGIHALMWNGSADSAVDLNPTLLRGIKSSNALGTDGVYQVGYGAGSPTNFGPHALLWRGTAESAVDLNPKNLPNIDDSVAVSVSGNQQVGYGMEHELNPFHYALLWHGSSDSAVDLHPTQFSEFSDSEAKDTNGTLQVGAARSLMPNRIRVRYSHAVLWYSTAESAVDLHLLLPAGFASSEAYSINQEGTIYGIAYDNNQIPHAVMWMAVPEPATTALAISVLAISATRRRRKTIL